MPKRPPAPARRVCPEVNDSRDTSRPITPTVHRELVRLGLVRPGGRNLDLGGGKFEKATGFLAENGVTSMVVDPSRTPEHNDAVWRWVRERPVDTVIVANVLNVICDAEARQQIIGVAAGAVRPGGLVAFQIYDGDKSGVGCKTTDGWQEHRKPPTYLAEIQRWFGRVERKDKIFYAYEPRERPVGEIPPDAPVKECSEKRGVKRLSNPGDGRKDTEEHARDKVADAPGVSAAVEQARRRFALSTVATAAARTVGSTLELLDARRLLSDDRPELAVREAERVFAAYGQQVSVDRTQRLSRDLKESARKHPEPHKSAYLAAASILSAADAGMDPTFAARALEHCVFARVGLGESRPEAEQIVVTQFAGHLTFSPRRSNPGGVELRWSFRPDEPGDVVVEVDAYLDNRNAGLLQLTRMEDDEVFEECMRDVRFLRRRHPGRAVGVLVVSNVKIEPWARGRGVGVALYAEAARLASSRFASMIIAHKCVNGQTSVEAERVWESSRFRDQVDVVGRAAYAGA